MCADRSVPREGERGGVGGGVVSSHVLDIQPSLLHPSPLITHLYRVLTHGGDWCSASVIYSSSRYATSTKLGSPTKKAFEMSRVLSYLWKRENFSSAGKERGGNRCGPPCGWNSSRGGLAMTGAGWMPPHRERGAHNSGKMPVSPIYRISYAEW